MCSSDLTSEEKTLALLAHLLGYFSSIIGPLIIYLTQKEKSRFVAFHAMQAILFHLIFDALYVVLFVSIVGILFIPFLAIGHLIFGIIVMIQSIQGEWYEIPIVGGITNKILGP